MSESACTTCGGYVYRKTPKGLCGDCLELDIEKGEAHHSSMLRCPRCRETWSVSDCDDGELYGEDCHDVSCPGCGHDFEITTHVSWSFSSPAVLS